MKNCKKGIVLFIAVIMVVLLAGCTKKEAASSGLPQTAELPRVAFIARTLGDTFAAWLADEFKNQATDYADKFVLDILDSRGDNELQNTLIENCITNKYDAIIIQPNGAELQQPYAKQAVDAGIIVITTNGRIEDIPGMSWIDTNPYDQGLVLAKDAVKNCPQDGTAVLLNGNPGHPHAVARWEAFHEEFVKARPDVTILAEAVLDSITESGAMAVMEDWEQSFDRIDAVLTVADVLTLACIEVVKDNPKYNNTLFYGVDCLPYAALSIKEGRFTGSVFQDAAEIAEVNLSSVAKLLSGEVKIVEEYLPVIYVDKTNVDPVLDTYVKYNMLTQAEVEAVR
jgi:inositol transport system substrate-binding protein